MATTRIRQLGDPILREVSREIAINEIRQEHVQGVIFQMKEVLNGIKAISNENGNAVSAPQVGHPIRAIVLRLNGVFVPMINPTVTPDSTDTFIFEEECFSFYQLRATVKRFKRVSVDFFDEHGETKSRTLEGEDAGLVQHEVDHLNGVFFLDRVTEEDRLRSVDFDLKDDPARLSQVKSMTAYMAEPIQRDPLHEPRSD